MSTITQRNFTDNLRQLLTETFEGPPGQGGSAYLDKGGGLFQTVDALSADVASRPPRAGAPTIAGHCGHVADYVRVLHNYMLGREQTVDWRLSWQVTEVDEARWDALRAELRERYDELVATVDSLQAWGDDPIGAAMAILAHTAYHLGAIRQVARAVDR